MSRIFAFDPTLRSSKAQKLFLFVAAALFILFVRSAPAQAQGIQLNASVALPSVEVSFTANDPPPPLPVYEQPVIPADGYLWTPGYWSWSDEGYYWVPGTWVEPPQVGLLWTPGYWGFDGGVYGFHAGYWGSTVGFYGGVNYGFGYVGVGFAGGRWDGGHFSYNTAVANVNTTIIHNTYHETVINNNTTVTRVSYNGGTGGVVARPTAAERAAAQQPHVAPTAAQTSHIQAASKNPALSAKANGGHPAIAATAKPGVFSGPGVVPAREAGRPAPATAAPKATAPSTERQAPAASSTTAPRTNTPSAERQAPSAPAEERPVAPKPAAPAKPAPAKPMPAKPTPVKPEAARPETERPVRQERPVEARPTEERAEQPKPPAPEASHAAPKPAPKPAPQERPKDEEK